ncbi:ATP-binding cassette permease MDL2 PWA37_003128 [Arxiozyma heterogenica]|uniref:ATP-binding cassette permease MDL2 n=1 Tax=Arxiozyma heterogenica TaxID=278026 RepID=UPI002EDE2629
MVQPSVFLLRYHISSTFHSIHKINFKVKFKLKLDSFWIPSHNFSILNNKSLKLNVPDNNSVLKQNILTSINKNNHNRNYFSYYVNNNSNNNNDNNNNIVQLKKYSKSQFSHSLQPINNSRDNSTITKNTSIQNNNNNTTATTTSRNKKLRATLDNESKDLWRLLKLIKNDWRMLTVALSLLTFSCAIGMAIPKIIGVVLDSLRSSDTIESLQDLVIWNGIHAPMFFGLTLAALCIGCIANYARVILLRLLSERLVVRLRAKLMKRILHMDATFFDKFKVGDLMSRVNNDAFLVSRSITQRVSDGVKALVMGTAGIGMMFSLSWQLSSVLLIMMGPPLLISSKIMGRHIRLNSKKLQESTANLTKLTEEQFNGIKTIQSFVAENSELHKFNHSIRDIFQIGKKFAFINAKFFTTASLISDCSFLIVLTYGSYLVLNGLLTVGDLTAFMLYTEYTGNAIFNMSNFYSELMQGAGAATRLFELTDSVPQVHSTRGAKLLPLKASSSIFPSSSSSSSSAAFTSTTEISLPLSSTKNPKSNTPMTAGSVEFQNVTFAYPTRPTVPIFKNLSFKIEAGSNYCIVGPSGKGKSTIAWLLIRCYDVQAGRILINEQNITSINAKSLRRKVAIVQQEPILMSGTIRENITYGLDYTPTKEEIRSVAKQCFCHGFIRKLPNTYDTMIGPQGTLLSGGQKQRIAIARALIKKPSILILDEATSALDVESEGAINYTFGQLMKSKSITIISIAHRLSTIRRSENIIVLGNDGNVVEIGKFKDLYEDPNSELSKLLNEKSLPTGTKSNNHSHDNLNYDIDNNDPLAGNDNIIQTNDATVVKQHQKKYQKTLNGEDRQQQSDHKLNKNLRTTTLQESNMTENADVDSELARLEELEQETIKDLLKDVSNETPIKLTTNE